MLNSKSYLYEQYQEWKMIFWVAFGLNIISFLGFIVHETYTSDDYSYIFTHVHHLPQGRWFAGFIYNTLLQGSFMPTLSPIIAIIFHIIAGIFVCKFWELNKTTSLFVILLWSLHSYHLETFNFRISTILISSVYILSSVAVWLAPKSKKYFFISVFLFYLTLSTYQVSLGYVVSVVMVYVLLGVTRGGFSKDSVRKAARYLLLYGAMIVLSVILYFVVTKVIFIVLDVQALQRFQIGFIKNYEQLQAKTAVVATLLFVRLMPLSEFIMPFFGKLVIFLISILGCIAAAQKTNSLWSRLGILLWIIIIPLGAILFMLPLAVLWMPWRVCLGLAIFIVGMFALTQEASRKWIRQTSIVLASVLVVYLLLNNNSIFYKHFLVNHDDKVMATRVIDKIQSLEQYKPGLPVVIVGNVPKQKFSKEGKSNQEIIVGYAKHAMQRRYSLATSAFTIGWGKYNILLKYMNLDCQRPTEDEITMAYSQAVGRKAWPDPSSVFIHNDVVILVLTPPNS